MEIITLKRRQDFQSVYRAKGCRKSSFTLLAKKHGLKNYHLVRVGFTCSKRIGNAVMRNRAKRRLKEALNRVLPNFGCAGWDYVLIGIPQKTVQQDFGVMMKELSQALQQIHAQKKHIRHN